MNLRKAQRLIQTDLAALTVEQFQKYKVALVDAYYHAKGEYGYHNDFFIEVPELKAFVPADKWLLKNIISKMGEAGI